MFQSPSPRRRFFLLAVFASAFAGPLLSAPRAEAHAIIVSSKPAANSKVPHGGLDILLQFNSRIQIDLSRLDLVDPAGKVSVLAITDGAAGGSLAGSTVVERNLDRLTVVVSLIFTFTFSRPRPSRLALRPVA